MKVSHIFCIPLIGRCVKEDKKMPSLYVQNKIWDKSHTSTYGMITMEQAQIGKILNVVENVLLVKQLSLKIILETFQSNIP